MKAYRSCSCRDPGTGRPYPRGQCPDLAKRGHGGWYARYEAPRGQDGKRRQPRIGPYVTKKDADEALVEVLGDVRPASTRVTGSSPWRRGSRRGWPRSGPS